MYIYLTKVKQKHHQFRLKVLKCTHSISQKQKHNVIKIPDICTICYNICLGEYVKRLGETNQQISNLAISATLL